MNTLLLLIALTGQATVEPIAKADLPKRAECTLCSFGGEEHGEEAVAAGVRYNGKSYFFCNAKEVATFKKDPEAYIPPVLPRPVPAFSLTDLAGKTWDATAMNERLVLVDFWATWCKPCHEMKPILDRARAKFGEQGFEVLSVSIDEKKADFDKFVGKTKFVNPVLFDSKQTWAAWKVRAIPAMFLVKKGKIVAQWNGKTTSAKLEKAIADHLR